MFALKKLVTPLILPPGIIVAAIIGIAMILIHRRHWKLAWANLCVGLVLWALSVPLVCNLLMRGLESDFTIPASPSGDVIILLGGSVIRGVPDISGRSAPSASTMGRVVAAVRLYHQVHLPIIVTGGRVHDDDGEAVATVAKRFLGELGVPENQILVEDRARDTQQNALLTAAICRREGYSRPILLTSAYHLKRAVMAFDAAGLPVIPYPAYFLGSRPELFAWRRLLPQAGALYVSAEALHEYLGLLYYRQGGL